MQVSSKYQRQLSPQPILHDMCSRFIGLSYFELASTCMSPHNTQTTTTVFRLTQLPPNDIRPDNRWWMARHSKVMYVRCYVVPHSQEGQRKVRGNRVYRRVQEKWYKCYLCSVFWAVSPYFLSLFLPYFYPFQITETELKATCVAKQRSKAQKFLFELESDVSFVSVTVQTCWFPFQLSYQHLPL